ncbi:hypothetical protein OAF54_03525 [bacterium]|nr:hypothetical protein [bacterium]
MEDILTVFNIIGDFVSELNNIYGKQYLKVALYNRLLEKTTIKHVANIKKHIELFRNFCCDNRDAIENKDEKLLVVNKIEFSNVVLIDFKHVFSITDDDTIKSSIWQYLLTLAAMLDPVSRAKKILSNTESKDGKENVVDLGGLESLIPDMMQSLSKTVDPEEKDPFKIVGDLCRSGELEKITKSVMSKMGGKNGGGLDMSKLLASAPALLKSLNKPK